LLVAAVDQGVNFFDTATYYRNYPLLRALIKAVGREKIVIASKSYASSADDAARDLQLALQELDTTYIDIFLLHEQLSSATLQGHAAALTYYHQAKQKGEVRAVGLSSHQVAAVRGAVLHPSIEIVHPLYNMSGFGIADGSATEMLQAIDECYQMGKGIYAMKVLGGGHLAPRYADCLRHVAALDCFASIAVGMQSLAELQVNLALLAGTHPPAAAVASLNKQQRQLRIEEYCTGCGLCLPRCSSAALKLSQGKLTLDASRCVTCGYCAAACPHFALKVW